LGAAFLQEAGALGATAPPIAVADQLADDTNRPLLLAHSKRSAEQQAWLFCLAVSASDRAERELFSDFADDWT